MQIYSRALLTLYFPFEASARGAFPWGSLSGAAAPALSLGAVAPAKTPKGTPSLAYVNSSNGDEQVNWVE